MRPESMVIMESESRWPTWLGDHADPSRHTAMVMQRPYESLACFKRRAAARIEWVQANAPPLTATLVCNRRSGRDSLASRRALLTNLLAMMRSVGSGHGVLVGDGEHTLQRKLMRLVGELNAGSSDDSTVSLRFRARVAADWTAAEATQQARVA